MGAVDVGTYVPLHTIVGTGSPSAMREGFLAEWPELNDEASTARCLAMRPRLPRSVDRIDPIYTCPLAHNPSAVAPLHAEAMNAALDALGYANAGLPWAPPREQTTEPVRVIALSVRADQHAAADHKARAREDW